MRSNLTRRAMALTVMAAWRLSLSIERPIQAVTTAARALSRGQLDQVVATARRDELGELSAALNQMARTIREYRQAGTARLTEVVRSAGFGRVRRATATPFNMVLEARP